MQKKERDLVGWKMYKHAYYSKIKMGFSKLEDVQTLDFPFCYTPFIILGGSIQRSNRGGQYPGKSLIVISTFHWVFICNIYV